MTQNRNLFNALAEKMVSVAIRLYQYKEAAVPRIFFIDLKKETGRERITQTLTDEFTEAMKACGFITTPSSVPGCYTITVNLADCILSAEQTKAAENARLLRA